MATTPTDENVPQMGMPVRRMREEMRRRSHRWAMLLDSGEAQQCRFISCSEARQSGSGVRVSQSIPREQIFVVLRDEQDFPHRDAGGRNSGDHVITHSTDVGTLPVMLWGLLHLARLDAEAVVGFFPLNPSAGEQTALDSAISDAYNLVQSNFCRDAVIMLGTLPERDEAEFGWIEPQPSLLGCSGGKVRNVLRFWDRPSREMTQSLLQRGCLVNTSGMVGRLEAFLAIIRRAQPEWLPAFEAAWRREIPTPTLAATCQFVPRGDFSRQILTASPETLLVLPVRQAAFTEPGQFY